ncbi:MAG: P-loop NTPase [Deltaproteobacteria bacterium]|nr:P-loop NTPase [Deltaproteobacteria bacterium]
MDLARERIITKRPATPKCEIWAVGGGKGGTGKSFLTSNIASYLSSTGKKVVLIDADLGGANLHSFLGVNKPQYSLSDFFEKGLSLEEIIGYYRSGKGKFGLVTGDINSLDSDKIKYTQKLKLFRHIKQIASDHVLIDLGAGSHYTAIDTFLLADKMIVVIVPEITSIENMYQFVKSVFFRKLKASFAEAGLKHIFLNMWSDRNEKNINNLRQLIDYLGKASYEYKEIINGVLNNFTINVVVNQARYDEDILVGNSIKSVLLKYLGIKSNYLGYIEYDDIVWNCIRKKQLLLRTHPSAASAKEIKKMTDYLVNIN